MPDNQIEGNQVPAGEPEAIGNSSQGGGQPSAENLAALAETVSNLSKSLESAQGEIKALKSGKDKAVDRVEKTAKELLEYARYLGVDEEKLIDAQRKMALDELVSQRFGKESKVDSGTIQPETAKVEIQSIVSSYGLDANDPEVIAAIGRVSDPIQQILELGKIAVNKAKMPTQTDAQSAPLKGGVSETKPDEAKLVAELNKLQFEPTKNAKRIEEIESALGW